MKQTRFEPKNCTPRFGLVAIVTLIYVSGSAATALATPPPPRVYRIPSLSPLPPIYRIRASFRIKPSLPVCVSKNSIDWVAETKFYIGWLQSSNVLVRREAAIALSCIAEKNPEAAKLAVPALTRALEDSEEIVRFLSAIILGNLSEKPTETLPRLIEVLHYGHNPSLLKLTGRTLGKVSQQVEQQVTKLSPPELDQILANLDTVVYLKSNNAEIKSAFADTKLQTVQTALDALKQERQRLQKIKLEKLQPSEIPSIFSDVNEFRKAFEVRYISSGSMLPTLQINDRLLIDKMANRKSEAIGFNSKSVSTVSNTELKRGDIVVFSPTETLRKQNFKDKFLKRIIGLPGETIAIRKGRVYINNQPLQESYIAELPQFESAPIKVPPNAYYVLGDNRNNSYDSHYWGFVPRSLIIGKAVAILYPLDRQRLLDPLTPLSADAQLVVNYLPAVLQMFAQDPILRQTLENPGERSLSVGKVLVAALNRSQQAYFVETNQFASEVQQIAPGIPSERVGYQLRVVEVDRKTIVQNVALAMQDELKTYVGIVSVDKTVSGEKRTQAIVCESERPTRQLPPPAKLSSQPQCPNGYKRVVN